jgi:sigma-B regulation protein RsbU (phosphoserine phosphatase)
MTVPKTQSETKDGRRLACLEIKGGYERAAYTIELPGFVAWVSCRPMAPATRGGDLHYLSVCSQGFVSRIALADVAGHGELVSAAANTLRDLLRRHADEWDQSDVVRELNDSFLKDAGEAEYATAFVLSHYSSSGEMLFTNAGHLPPLWYCAEANEWGFLMDSTPYAKEITDLPIGLIPGTPYSQTAVQLGWSDVLVLYTDGITESINHAGEQLGRAGLLRLVSDVPAGSADGTGQALIAQLEDFREGSPATDDETLIVLQHRRPASDVIWPGF